MTEYNWREILNQDLNYINVIGYGSLLNSNTHSYDKRYLTPVVIKGFRRVYNLKLIPDGYSNEYLNNLWKYLVPYGISTDNDVKNLNINNDCVLNCEYVGNNQMMNCLLMRVNKEDFHELSLREAYYNLIKTNYTIIDPQTGRTTGKGENAYVLVAKEGATIENGKAFVPYHDNVKQGAYSLGEYFGNQFEKTTLGV